MKLSSLLIFALASASTAFASSIPLVSRQSTEWQYTCEPTYAKPSNFKAFNLGGCAAQLSFTKDQYIGIRWYFDAVYADGSRVTYTPYRDFNTFGVSDPFYPYLGNNFNTRYPGSSGFTAIHEFTNVCKENKAPVAWYFYTTVAGACQGGSYNYTSPRVPVYSNGAVVTRPAKASGVALRRLNTAGDFQISWAAVPAAAAYSVIVEYPTGTDEVGNAYTNVRGVRVPSGNLSTTVATGTKRPGDARSVIVHVVDSKGLWSFTNDVAIIRAN